MPNIQHTTRDTDIQLEAYLHVPTLWFSPGLAITPSISVPPQGRDTQHTTGDTDIAHYVHINVMS